MSPYEGEIIFLGVDNTIAFYDIIAGHATHVVANECVGLMRRRCALALSWIPTELMPADDASRLVYDGLVNAKVVGVPSKVRLPPSLEIKRRGCLITLKCVRRSYITAPFCS